MKILSKLFIYSSLVLAAISCHAAITYTYSYTTTPGGSGLYTDNSLDKLDDGIAMVPVWPDTAVNSNLDNLVGILQY